MAETTGATLGCTVTFQWLQAKFLLERHAHPRGELFSATDHEIEAAQLLGGTAADKALQQRGGSDHDGPPIGARDELSDDFRLQGIRMVDAPQTVSQREPQGCHEAKGL